MSESITNTAFEKMVGIGDIAEALGVPVKTIYKWCNEDSIPRYKVGRSLKFRLSEINTWLESKREGCKRISQ